MKTTTTNKTKKGLKPQRKPQQRGTQQRPPQHRQPKQIQLQLGNHDQEQ